MATRGATVQIVYNHIPRIAAALRPACGEIVQETILAIETGAKIVGPVDTGALRASLQSDMTGDTSGQGANNTDFSVYVEYGTVHMGERPYMTPAAEAERRHFMRKMSDLEGRLE